MRALRAFARIRTQVRNIRFALRRSYGRSCVTDVALQKHPRESERMSQRIEDLRNLTLKKVRIQAGVALFLQFVVY